jgi:hypothetical protein
MYEQDAMSKSGWPFFMAFRYGGAKVIEDAMDSSKHAGATNTSTTRSIHKVFDSRSNLDESSGVLFLHNLDIPGTKLSYRIRVFAAHLTITSVTGISDNTHFGWEHPVDSHDQVLVTRRGSDVWQLPRGRNGDGTRKDGCAGKPKAVELQRREYADEMHCFAQPGARSSAVIDLWLSFLVVHTLRFHQIKLFENA